MESGRILRQKLQPVQIPSSISLEELGDSEDEGSMSDVVDYDESPWTKITQNIRSSPESRHFQPPEYSASSNRNASIPLSRLAAGHEETDEAVSDSNSKSRDYNQNSVEYEDMSTTSSSTSATSRTCSICPHCDGSIPQEELPGHLHQHVLNGTINFARLKEIMLRQKTRYDQPSSSSVDSEPVSTSSANRSESLLRVDRVDPVQHGEFYCGQCSSVFTNSFEFELHERNHQAESLFKCQHCNKTFTKADVYEKHSKIHTGEGAHKCHLCPKTFNQRVHLRSHLRKHNGEKPYACAYCPRQYADRSSLTYHERTHTGERPYPCPYCSRGFSKSGALKGHLVTHLRGGSEDAESTQGTSDETLPILQMDDNSKKILDTAFHACRYCNKTFANLSTVRIHERCHSGERPYSCSFSDCNKTFCQLAHLNTHLKTHEPGAKQPGRRRVFVCLRCPSEFSTMEALGEHTALDHNSEVEEKFQCEYCPQTFRAEKLLMLHLTSFHKLKSHTEAYELSD